MYSLLQPIQDIPFSVVDVETTGASTDYGDRIVEVGIARVEGGRIAAEYQQLIDPRRRISPGVSALTGITQEMLIGQPTFSEALPQFLPMLQGAVVVGHNVGFDLGFLRREFRGAGKELPQELGNAQVLDTVRIARRRFGRGGNGLQRLCRNLGYEPTAAHRAFPDAVTTYHVFDRLMLPVGGWRLSLCDAILQQGGPMGLAPRNPRESELPLALEEALEQRAAVMMEYLDANQQRTQRVIEPISIRRFKGEMTLVAHCQLRNDRRHFKLERIVQLTRLGETTVQEQVTVEHSATQPGLFD